MEAGSRIEVYAVNQQKGFVTHTTEMVKAMDLFQQVANIYE